MWSRRPGWPFNQALPGIQAPPAGRPGALRKVVSRDSGWSSSIGGGRSELDGILPSLNLRLIDEHHQHGVLTEFADYHNRDRPHRSLGLQSPLPSRILAHGRVVSRSAACTTSRLEALD